MGVRGLFKALRKDTPSAFVRDVSVMRDRIAGGAAAVDAANHACRIAFAFSTTDHFTIAVELKRWLARLRDVLGVSHFFFVCDGPNVAAKSWEAGRRKAHRKRDTELLAEKKEKLATMIMDAISTPQSSMTALPPSATHVDGTGHEWDVLVGGEDPMVTMSKKVASHEARHAIRITQKDVAIIAKKLSSICPFVTELHASGEGEFACAELVHRGVATLVISNDSDVVPLAAPYTLCIFPRRDMEMLDLSVVMEGLSMDATQLRHMCVLAGTDFAPYIRGAGVRKSIALIRRHGTLGRCLLSWNKKVATKSYRQPVLSRECSADPSDVKGCMVCGSGSRMSCDVCEKYVCGDKGCIEMHRQWCFNAVVSSCMLIAERTFRDVSESCHGSIR